MLIVVDFAVTLVVVFVSTAVAMDCVMFVHKIVVVEELSVTVIVFCDVVFAVTDCVLKKSGVKMPVHKTVVAAVRDIAFFNVWFVCFFFNLYYLLLWKFLQLPMCIIA